MWPGEILTLSTWRLHWGVWLGLGPYSPDHTIELGRSHITKLKFLIKLKFILIWKEPLLVTFGLLKFPP